MTNSTCRLGLRFCQGSRPNFVNYTTRSLCTGATSVNLIISRNLSFQTHKRPTAAKEPTSPLLSLPSTASSFFTPSLCRTRRNASTTSSSSSASEAIKSNPAQSSSNIILDWNTFFSLRQSRRRYSLVSSIITSFGTTGSTFVFLSTQPELADEITKLVPTDPFVSMGIFTFGATLFGWLIGPFFGNAVWRMFHRSRLAEFTIKERAFFERIKRHRVNPTGASTNNPVPDYYGEKIGSVAGYRRWLKDQRAFNRKREGSYSATI